MTTNLITLNTGGIVRALAALAFVLVVASVGAQLAAFVTGRSYIYGLVQLFYLDAENNVPTFFSSFLLLFAALLFALITTLKRRQAASHVLQWGTLSLGLALLAVDEVASIHEKLIRPMRELMGGDTPTVFYYGWVAPALVLLFGIGLFLLGFLAHLPKEVRRRFLAAAILYLGAAVGMEMIEGRYEASRHVPYLPYTEFNQQIPDFPYSAMITIEEGVEMIGIIVLIWSLLGYIAENYGEVRLRVDGIYGRATKAGIQTVIARDIDPPL